MSNHSKIKATTSGRRFSVEIPPVDEWILELDPYRVGKLTTGALVVVEWCEFDQGVGWTAGIFKDFHAILDTGCYVHEFLRPLAHRLGIERFRWHNAYGKPLWCDTDDYLADLPATPEEERARREHTAAQFEASGQPEAAAAFREAMSKQPLGKWL